MDQVKKAAAQENPQYAPGRAVHGSRHRISRSTPTAAMANATRTLTLLPAAVLVAMGTQFTRFEEFCTT